MTTTSQGHELRAVADLLGRLLLVELDRAELERLGQAELAPALVGLGFELPAPALQDAWLEQQAADFHELFLRPETGPLVQSLWVEGRYEGDCTVRVRKLAEASGLEFQRAAARGAAVDHLGSLLLLWSATDGCMQPIADELVAAHLSWAVAPLRQLETAGGFYGAVARATGQLLAALADA